MNLSNFAERLSELMFDQQLKPRGLDKMIGCAHSTIERYLAGTSYPTVEITIRLADYFCCTTDFILGIENENNVKAFQPCPPFGERLLKLCSDNHITRAYLQRKTNIPESVMRYWVKGKTKPSIVNVIKIAEALDFSVDYVLGREI